MSRKHNTKHRRTLSKYPKRLAKRGLTSSAVRMPELENLRRRQGCRFYDAPIHARYEDVVL